MQSRPTFKDTDPHDIFAIESLLAAHAEKSPPLAHDPAAADVAPQMNAAPTPQILAAPSVGAPASQTEPTFHITDWRDLEVDSVRPGEEIKVNAIRPPGERPMSKWAKRLAMALLGLFAAIAAAGWQQYGEEAKAMAAEWTPPFLLAALPSAAKPTMAEQPGATAPAVAAEQAVVAEPAAAVPAQPVPAAPAAAAPQTDSAQLQSLARDLAAMGQQVEELKTTVAQLRASQAQLTRELAKASEAKVSEVRASEAKVSAVTPPPPAARPAAPPVRKPKPASSYSPSYSPAPMAAAPVQAAAPPPAPPQRTIADDGEPVVRPPLPLR